MSCQAHCQAHQHDDAVRDLWQNIIKLLSEEDAKLHSRSSLAGYNRLVANPRHTLLLLRCVSKMLKGIASSPLHIWRHVVWLKIIIPVALSRTVRSRNQGAPVGFPITSEHFSRSWSDLCWWVWIWLAPTSFRDTQPCFFSRYVYLIIPASNDSSPRDLPPTGDIRKK